MTPRLTKTALFILSGLSGLSSVLIPPSASAATRECELIEKICVDDADRVVDGTTISRPCWRYSSRYRCRQPSPEAGRCEAPAASALATESPKTIPADCRIVNRVCTAGAETPDDPDCRAVRAELSCSSPPAGPGIAARPPETHASITTTQTPNAADLEALLAKGCRFTKKSCLDAAAHEVPVTNWPGHAVTVTPPASAILESACWEAAFELSCPADSTAASCEALEAAGCRPKGDKDDKVCEAKDEAGNCVRWSIAYVCGEAVEGDDIEIDGPIEIPDGGTTTDDSDCVKKLEAAAVEGLSCSEVSRTCVEPGRTEIIDGKPVTLPCALYEASYRCESEGANGCEALEALAASGICREEAPPECSQTNESDECLKWSAKYLCSEKSESGLHAALPENLQSCPASPAVHASTLPALSMLRGLASDHRSLPVTPDDVAPAESLGTVVQSTGADEDSCSAFAADPRCAITSDVCVEGAGVKLINGEYVYRDCWRRERVYACRAPSGDDCAALDQNPNCRLVEETCPDGEPDCARPTRVYECTTGESSTTVGEVCDGEACIAGVCAPVDDDPDKDFAEGVVGMEIGREAGIYGDVVSGRYFSGEHLTCIDRRGAASCCRSDARAAPSNAAFSLWLDFGLEAGAEAVKYVGSPYVYDILAYSDSTSWLLTKLYGTAGSGVYNPSFSYWGVTASYTTGEGLTFSFSPAGFALAAAMKYWGEWQSCRAEDQRTAMARGAGLCKYVGDTCEKAAGGFGCLESASHFVCFNSKLARIVNEQGRKQVGRGWGKPAHPETAGFTQEELMALDFSKMDLSEFVADVIREAEGKADGIDRDAILERATERVETMLAGSLSPTAPVAGAVGKHAGDVPNDPTAPAGSTASRGTGAAARLPLYRRPFSSKANDADDFGVRFRWSDSLP